MKIYYIILLGGFIMIGKKIKINDYKFTYGKEVMYVNVYGAFKSGKSGNKYVIYSYIIDVAKMYAYKYYSLMRRFVNICIGNC